MMSSSATEAASAVRNPQNMTVAEFRDLYTSRVSDPRMPSGKQILMTRSSFNDLYDQMKEEDETLARSDLPAIPSLPSHSISSSSSAMTIYSSSPCSSPPDISLPSSSSSLSSPEQFKARLIDMLKDPTLLNDRRASISYFLYGGAAPPTTTPNQIHNLVDNSIRVRDINNFVDNLMSWRLNRDLAMNDRQVARTTVSGGGGADVAGNISVSSSSSYTSGSEVNVDDAIAAAIAASAHYQETAGSSMMSSSATEAPSAVRNDPPFLPIAYWDMLVARLGESDTIQGASTAGCGGGEKDDPDPDVAQAGGEGAGGTGVAHAASGVVAYASMSSSTASSGVVEDPSLPPVQDSSSIPPSYGVTSGVRRGRPPRRSTPVVAVPADNHHVPAEPKTRAAKRRASIPHVVLCSTPNCNWFAEGVPSPELDRELEEHLSTPHQDPTPAAARHTASGNGRHRIRIVSKEQVVVLLILIAYIECTTALTRTFNFCLIISVLILI
jgi:hypothetical protein